MNENTKVSDKHTVILKMYMDEKYKGIRQTH